MKQLFHHINHLTSIVRCASIITSQQGLAFHLGEECLTSVNTLRIRTPKIKNLSHCYFTAYDS